MSLQKNSKREAESDRFDYPGPVKWMNDGGKQRIVSNIFQRLEPSSRVDPVPTHIDFDLKDFFNFWYMGPNTYIEVKGQFQSCTPQDNTKEPPTPQTAWAGVAANDSANVVVEPNWFESLIKRIEVHHGGVAVYTSDEGASMSHLVNTYLYNYMNKDVKKKLCPQACHPGNGVPSKKGAWDIGEDTEWQHYSKSIFLGGTSHVVFNWVPMHVFPFFQGKNYLENEPKLMPMPALKPMLVRFYLNDNPMSIFKKKANNKKLYRFALSSFAICYEQVKLSTNAHRMLMSNKVLEYPGVTRLTKRVTINTGDMSSVTTIPNIPMPESIFVFAVPKEVPNGTFLYQNATTTDVFLAHNITGVKFAYGNQNFFELEPHIGMITKTPIENKLVTDLRDYPPFGLMFDEEKINFDAVKDGAKNTPYPHVYVNFCCDKDGSRLLPINEKGIQGSVLKNFVNAQKVKTYNPLDLTFTFEAPGAAANATYIVYMVYTDNYVVLDMPKTGSTFRSHYITTITN